MVKTDRKKDTGESDGKSLVLCGKKAQEEYRFLIKFNVLHQCCSVLVSNSYKLNLYVNRPVKL